jgi:1-acyl-sn-glycerol-3-phosphate acyltransferase
VLKPINHAWRLVCTGLAFAGLGLGGSLMAVTLFPLVGLVTRDPVRRQDRVQYCVYTSFRLYLFLLKMLGVIELDVRRAERLAGLQGRLIVANHPTLLDIVLLMALVPRAQCVVKHQLWRNPFLRPVVRGAGYISNDLPADALLAACAAALQTGNNLIIFPEGTRTRPGEALRFRRGFANVATATAADIVPVTITCEPWTLTKGAQWYDIPPTKPRFAVAIGETIPIQQFLQLGARPLAARRLVTFLERYYTERLTDGRPGTGDQAAHRQCVEARGLVT